MYNLGIYLLILLLILDISTSGILFDYRLRCPDTAEKWRENKNSYICHGDTEYHCMHDQHGRYVVFCASSIWIQPDYCPEFNAKASLIDVILCQGAVDGCPGNVYLSNTVYQYPSCFRTVIRSTTTTPVSDNRTVTRLTKLRYTTTMQTKLGNEEKRDLTVSTGVILGIVSGIILPILVFLVIIFLLRRKRQKTYKEENKSYVNYSKPDYLKKEGTEISDSETTPCLEDSTKENDEEPRKEETFVVPRLYDDGVEILREKGFIIIVGGSGSGKTTLANHILKDKFKGSHVLHMKPKQTTIPEIKSDKDVIVVWDNCFGIWKDCELEENVKTDVRNTIISLIDRCKDRKNHKAIICMDLPSYEKYFIDKFKDCIVNLSENYEFVIERERFKNMFDRGIYVGHISNDVGFPLLVKLIVEHHMPNEQTKDFMKKPITKLIENFDDLSKNERDVYVTLVYALCNTPSLNQKHMNWKNWTKLKVECQSKDKNKNNPQQECKDINNPHQETKDKDNSNQQQENSDKDNIDPQQESTDRGRTGEYGQLEEAKHPSKDSNAIYKKSNCIEMNSSLIKYLEKTENPNVFRFRHHFLARLLLRYHLENVGSKGILEVGNEEIRSVVEKLQSSLSKLKPDQLGAS
ncbi:uncharacterized protein LOC134254325 isoform X2 [Saccostrea cucullata]|uniref:uncharacterized protein LOC134254325 isoform X2 n=1 Tax=Saccostrea cuccullata TaxID=36930 RepID=UPI002ED3B2F8